MSGHVFARSPRADLPVAVSGTGAEVVDAAGRRYLDGSGGAIVVGIGHGVTEVVDAIAEQARRIAYVHGTRSPPSRSRRTRTSWRPSCRWTTPGSTPCPAAARRSRRR